MARPAHLVDVSDLDPALPRQELQQYKFVDDDFEITVVLQLPEAVPLDQVCACGCLCDGGVYLCLVVVVVCMCVLGGAGGGPAVQVCG